MPGLRFNEDRAMIAFADKLITDKGITGLTREQRGGLRRNLIEAMNARLEEAVIMALPDDEILELEKMLEGDATEEQVDELLDGSGVDFIVAYKQGLKAFRDAYLAGEIEVLIPEAKDAEPKKQPENSVKNVPEVKGEVKTEAEVKEHEGNTTVGAEASEGSLAEALKQAQAAMPKTEARPEVEKPKAEVQPEVEVTKVEVQAQAESEMPTAGVQTQPGQVQPEVETPKADAQMQPSQGVNAQSNNANATQGTSQAEAEMLAAIQQAEAGLAGVKGLVQESAVNATPEANAVPSAAPAQLVTDVNVLPNGAPAQTSAPNVAQAPAVQVQAVPAQPTPVVNNGPVAMNGAVATAPADGQNLAMAANGMATTPMNAATPVVEGMAPVANAAGAVNGAGNAPVMTPMGQSVNVANPAAQSVQMAQPVQPAPMVQPVQAMSPVNPIHAAPVVNPMPMNESNMTNLNNINNNGTAMTGEGM